MAARKKYFDSYDPKKDNCAVCGAIPTYARNLCSSCYHKVRTRKLQNETSLEVLKEKLSSNREHQFSQYDPVKDKCVICGASPTFARCYCQRDYERVRRSGELENRDVDDVIRKVFPERLQPDFVKRQSIKNTSPQTRKAKWESRNNGRRKWPEFGDDGDPYVFRGDK